MKIRLAMVMTLACVVTYGCSDTDSNDDEQITETSDAGDVADSDTSDDAQTDAGDGADADANDPQVDGGSQADPEGFYEITEVTYNSEGCDLSQVQARPPTWPYVVVRYEMTVWGPGYMAYRCEEADGCSPDNYDIWWNLKDVEASDAEELPAPEDRARGELELTSYSTGWGDGQCTAARLRHQGEFGEGTIRVTEWSLVADVPEVDSEWDCHPDLARDLPDDRFDCETKGIWLGAKR